MTASKKQLEQALRKAEARDRKRRTQMKVSGRNVFTLAKSIDSKAKRKSK